MLREKVRCTYERCLSALLIQDTSHIMSFNWCVVFTSIRNVFLFFKMEQISAQSPILKASFKKINLINKHWHLNTLIKQVSGLGLLFPKVSISQDSRIIYSDATYWGVFPSSLFSNNDNKRQRDSKNSWFFKANVHGQFTACFWNKLLILKNSSYTRTLKYKMALINFCQLL